MSVLTAAASAISSRLGRRTALVKKLRPAYDRALDILYGETGIPAFSESETFLVCPRVRKFVTVEGDVYRYLKATIRPGDTVLDIGAFLGIYAILAARWTGLQGRVIAFEPTPASLPFLHRHLTMNGVEQNVTALACAVGRSHGKAQLFQHSDAYLNSVEFADPTVSAAAYVQVPMLSIDDACAMFDLYPDIIRIDVQGLEADVLRGAAQTIRKHPQLKIVVEIHPQLWQLRGLDERGFRLLLRDLGLFGTSPNGDAPAYFPDAHLFLQSVEALAVPL